MTLRTHLIVVAIIIAVVFIAWQAMRSNAPPVEAVQPGGHAIIIAHASWGLNCMSMPGQMMTTNQPSGVKQSQPGREDNILKAVSALCDGKPQCSIRNAPETFGMDPVPECPEKEISIEYRCFSYDRPWTLTIAPRDTGVIDCVNRPKP